MLWPSYSPCYMLLPVRHNRLVHLTLSSWDRSLSLCMHAGVLLCPGGECGCEPQDLQSRLQSTHDATDGPGCRAAIPLKCRGPGKKSCWGEPVIPRPRPVRKKCVRPPVPVPYLDLSYLNTALLSWFSSTMRTPKPPLFWTLLPLGHFIPCFGHFMFYFC